MIVFIICYLALLLAYLFTKTADNFKRKAINKIILALMFAIYALVETIRLGNFQVNNIHFWGLIGILVAALGDIILIWDFKKGGLVFAIGNVFLFLYGVLLLNLIGFTLKNYWWFLLIFVALNYGMIALVKADWFENMNKYMRKGFPIYFSSVSLHGSLGIVGILLILLADFEIPERLMIKALLLNIGFFLFMVSDMFLALYRFKDQKNNFATIANSITYFGGLLLISLSTSFNL